MDKAWMFFVTFMALYLTATAQEVCRRGTCGEACDRFKCSDANGTCLTREEAENWENLGGVVIWRGRGYWCQHYKKCKCCLPLEDPICVPACENGGICIETDVCECPVGWTGARCETPICVPACENGGICIAPNVCDCSVGWTGATCETPICVPGCQNGGICSAPDVCDCSVGWTGATCETPICVPACGNGGICSAPDVCDCPVGWTGATCETPICVPACENGGTCIRPDECTCAPGFIGDFCQFIDCSERTNCINNNGICYDKTDPILLNNVTCPQTDNGRNWCTPMCACCFGA